MTRWTLRTLFKLGCVGLIVAITSPSFGLDVQESRGKVTRGDEHILNFYFNCKGPIAPITATAEKGSVRIEPSTRQICDHNFQPVQQIVYASPKDYTGLDIVRFYIKGALAGIKTLEVGDERTIRLKVKGSRTMVLAAGEERAIYSSWDCTKTENVKPPFISKSKGAIDIRDSTAAVCGSSTYPIRKVFYRAPQGFVGEDEVVIAGPFGPPLTTKFVIGKSEPIDAGPPATAAAVPAATPTVAAAAPTAPATPPPPPVAAPKPYEPAPPKIVTDLAKLDEDKDRELSIWDDEKAMTGFFTHDFMTDWRKAHQQGGQVLDRDPLTLDQNSQGMHVLDVLSHEIDGADARVTVLFEERSADDGKVYLPARSALFSLKWENGGWRIDEVKVFGAKTLTSDGKADPEAVAMAEGLHAYLRYYQAHPHVD